jgi:hypothetical protein
MNRKASLNLSIQAIVIVVIAFVVLGLGLGFVRGQFQQITKTSSQVQKQIEQQILDDLRRGNNKLSFPTDELRLETGEDSVQAIGVKNTKDSELTLRMDFQVKTDQGFTSFVSEKEESLTTSGGTSFDARMTWDNTAQTYTQNEARVIPVTITAPDKSGTYLYKVRILDASDKVFDERTFFIRTS